MITLYEAPTLKTTENVFCLFYSINKSIMLNIKKVTVTYCITIK